MAFRYGYFDSDIIGIDDEGMPIFDRAETSDLFALLLASLVSDGVLAQPATCFQVRAAGNGMGLEVQPGFAMVRGHFGYNDEVLQMTIGSAPRSYSRIDRVVLRCNYLERMVEIVIKSGTEAANPVPPALVRPAAGDYFEMCLANIRISAGQKTITQSSITDTRPDSAVCGYITQLIDHLDTSVFFAQLDKFYEEFVAKSNSSYTEFERMASDAYKKFVSDITAFINTLKDDSTDAYNSLTGHFAELESLGQQKYKELAGYIAELREKGDADLAEITQQLLDFRNTHEADFIAWFDHIREVFGTDPAGNQQNQIDALASRTGDVEEMLYTGMAAAKIITDEGDYLTDDTGNPLLAEWPICSSSCG